MRQLQAPRHRRLVDEERAAADQYAAPLPAALPSAFAARFQSMRQVNLHTFESARGNVEVKIGGHALDHKRMLGAESHGASQRGPRKTAPQHEHDWLARVESRAFEARAPPVLEYSCVKIGGHALDHVPFVGRGQPSRPLWGYPRLVWQGPAAPPATEFAPAWHMGAATRVVGVGRSVGNLAACSRCGSMRQLPRVQLCCGHPLCAGCISSTTLRHAELADGTCLVECRQCQDAVAVEAVVFPNRVLHFPHARVRSLAALRQRIQHEGRALCIDWKFGAAAAALAVAARRVLNRLPLATEVGGARSASFSIGLAKADMDLPKAEQCDSERWRKRVQSLQPPSRLLSYEFVQTLGVGNFAEVMLVKRKNGKLLVVKESDRLQEAVNEIRLLSKIRSPHVVRIRHYFVEDIGHRQFAYIEMEYCDRGDLSQWLKQHGRFKATAFDRIFRQLCLGLAEIHRHSIVHRDIKPGNVLLTSEGTAKIADFGVSTCLESDLLTHHAAGTLAFMAPEVRRYFLGEDVSYGTQADIWSLGALALAMLTGEPEPQISTRSLDAIVEGLRQQHIADKYVNLVRQTLDVDPQKRPTLASLLEMFPPMTARL